MSPKKPVENLRVLCLEAVSEICLDAIKCAGEDCIKEFKGYFGDLPRILKESVLLRILSLTPLSSFTKWVSFCIFQYNCRQFEARNISLKFHEKFAQRLENLYYLHLADSQINEKTLCRIIRRCPNLRALFIPNQGTDKILKEIRCLKFLQLLDISGYAIISDEGFNNLSNDTLRVLAIGNSFTNALGQFGDYEVISQILPQLPNLTEIRIYEHTGKGISNFKVPYISKLKVISDYDTSHEQMKAIISVCPQLEELFIEDPDNVVFEYLGELSDLKTLKISRVSVGILNLKIKNLTLQSLELKNMTVNMNEICLTLESLVMRSCDIYTDFSDRICLRNLKNIELINCKIKREMFILLLEYSEYLQKLALSDDIGLTDSDIRNLCQRKKLKQLEELWLSLARELTSDSVILLMNHCDNLTTLGTLNGWNIDKMEVNYLRCVVHLTNTNLKLLYFNCF